MITEQLIKRIARIVLNKTGINCSANGLINAVKETIKNTHNTNGVVFLQKLENNDKESNKILEELIKQLTPKSPIFFEPAYQFNLLKEEILPSMIDQYSKSQRPIRIWNIDTRTGEAVYSLAILLNEFLPFEIANIELIATDGEEANLEHARQAVYQYWALRKVDFDVLSKYFTPMGNGYQINENIKKYVEFKKIDIFNDSYPDDIDLILCSTEMDYTETVQKDIFERLYRSLNVDGYMIINCPGLPETLSDKMKMIEYPDGIVYQKIKYIEDIIDDDTVLTPIIVTKHRNEEIIIDLDNSEETAEKNPVIEEESTDIKQDDSDDLPELIEEDVHEISLIKLKKMIKADSYNKTLILEFIKRLWSCGNLTEALEWSEQLLVLEPLNPNVHYIMGIIYEELGEEGQAMKTYEKLITIKPEAVIGYFSIACLAGKLQQPKKAIKYFQHTQTMISNLNPEDNIEFAELPVKDIDSMLKAELESLNK